jgi:hypothetical protein
VYEISVIRDDSRQHAGSAPGLGTTFELDGEPVSFIPLEDGDAGGTHHVTVRVARRRPSQDVAPPELLAVPLAQESLQTLC